MDFRLRDELMRWIDESGLFVGGFDVISLAGASKSLADGNDQIRDFFLQQVSVSTDLHHAERIVVFHHSDCGAYAKDYSFASPEKEREQQIADMKKTREILQSRYPAVEVVLAYGKLEDEHGARVTFEIVQG